MDPTRKQLSNVFVDVTYKYNVDAQVLNCIIARNRKMVRD